MVEVTQVGREAANRWMGSLPRDQFEILLFLMSEERIGTRNRLLRALADDPAMVERVARALMIDDGIDPDVFKGMHGGFGHYADTAQAVLHAVGGGE